MSPLLYLLFHHIRKEGQKWFAYTWKGEDHIAAFLALGYNPPASVIIKSEDITTIWTSTEHPTDPGYQWHRVDAAECARS